MATGSDHTDSPFRSGARGSRSGHMTTVTPTQQGGSSMQGSPSHYHHVMGVPPTESDATSSLWMGARNGEGKQVSPEYGEW